MPYGPGGDPGPLDYSDEITRATAKERAEYEDWKRKEREERKKQIRRIDQLLEICSIDYILPLTQAKQILLDELRPPRILYGSEFNEVL